MPSLDPTNTSTHGPTSEATTTRGGKRKANARSRSNTAAAAGSLAAALTGAASAGRQQDRLLAADGLFVMEEGYNFEDNAEQELLAMWVV